MGSHSNYDAKDFDSQVRDEFMRRRTERGEQMIASGASSLAAAPALETWTADEIQVAKLPDDEQGILRISIGGGEHLPLRGDYCRFRGERGQCIRLLERALAAMQHGPQPAAAEEAAP